MNRTQMIEALKSGVTISHSLFGDDEHFYMRDNVIYDENGYNMRGIHDEFMTIRKGEGWEDGWFKKDIVIVDEVMASPLLENLVEFTRHDVPTPMFTSAPKLKHSAHYRPVRTEAKINRNSACSCGSGLKYKKCCINK